MQLRTELLIIGSGISGLSLALKAADRMDVTIVTKREAMESNTRYAQGGIASVMHGADNFDSHVRDTFIAGAELGDMDVIEDVVSAGPRLVGELLKCGVRFTKRNKSDFDLAIEGGHSQRRVLHAADLTGYEIEKKLHDKVCRHPRIRILEHHVAIDLLTDRNLKNKTGEKICYGAYVFNRKNNTILTVRSKAAVLASGGAGKVYLYTSNPDIATGDGIAMAYRAGCEIANLEFVQFHPTCLYHARAKSFLISEALRGEGGKLRLMGGESFMPRYHAKKELAPRDIVARAIDHELKKRGDAYVTLDMTHHPREFLRKRFPNIYKTCREFGYDLAKAPIPVVPAAHYFCGGVKVDRRGRTALGNLYAVGETSCTGLHGANRLASNSLLEGIAYADFVAKDLAARGDLRDFDKADARDWSAFDAVDSDEAVVITQNWDEIRRLMWNYVGIVRSDKRLKRAERRIQLLREEIKEYYWNFKLSADLLELRNIATVAELTVKSALKRKESIGLHYTIDHPDRAQKSVRFNVVRKEK
jgi:L-aspartate oxidase